MSETAATEPTEISRFVEEAFDRRLLAWQSAMNDVGNWLDRQCRTILDRGDPSRLQVQPGRIKECARTVDKLRRKIVEGPGVTVGSVDDVELHIRDLVGTKVLCKSTRDQVLLRDHIRGLTGDDCFEIDEVKDFTESVKPSGYRAVHFIFRVPVRGEEPVVVELQIKTRLQDAWGELTHEDLYKPGAAIKPTDFHKSVGRTMANLLAEVDRLADDLAEEMSASLESSTLLGDAPEPCTEPGDGADAEVSVDEEAEVTVRSTGPRYALAVDEDGVQGLISAQAVRDALGVRTIIDVDDYVRRGDRLRVRVIDNDRGLYYVPLALAQSDSDGPADD